MKATTVTDYIQHAPKEAQARLREMRALVKKAAPKATEKIGYGVPYYSYHGMFVAYGASKKHIGLYSMSYTFFKKYAKEAGKYQSSVSTLQFPFDKPLPKVMLLKLLKARAKENEAKAKTKAKTKKRVKK